MGWEMVPKQQNVYKASGKGLAAGQCLFLGCPESPGQLWMVSWGQRCPGRVEIPPRPAGQGARTGWTPLGSWVLSSQPVGGYGRIPQNPFRWQ